MANEDYIKQGIAGPYCPTARLTSALTRLATSLTYNSLLSPIPDPIQLNRAILIDDEIIAVTAISGNTLTIERGCCDTIPATHAANATIWFFDDSVASNETEYGGTETVGVKLLPRTATSGTIPNSGSPPNQLTFNFRFARPYPPGNVQIDGEPWYTTGIAMGAGNTSLSITWAHRDRVTQADQLVGHTAASIGPEVGVTYKIVVRRTDTNVVIRTVTGITASIWIYERSVAGADLSGASGSVPISIELVAVRGSLESLYKYTMVATVSPPPPPLSFVGRNEVYNNFGSSLSVPTHQEGDLLILIERAPSTPSVRSGWTSIGTLGAQFSGQSARLSYIVDTSNTINAIAFSGSPGAVSMVYVYRGAAAPRNAATANAGPVTNISIPSVDLSSGGGTSWVFAFIAINQASLISTSGVTKRRGYEDGQNIGGGSWATADSNAPVSSISASASWAASGHVAAIAFELPGTAQATPPVQRRQYIRPVVATQDLLLAAQSRLLAGNVVDADILLSSDEGVSYDEVVSNGSNFAAYTVTSRYLDAILSNGVYLSVFINTVENLAGMIRGNVNTLPGVLPVRSENNLTTETWYQHGYPRVGNGTVIHTIGIFAENLTFYIIGQYANAAPAVMHLFAAPESGVFESQGAIQQDPADPNMVAVENAASFSNFFANGIILKKIDGRWWAIGTRAAYYTDDTNGVSNWRRANVGFGETTRTNPPPVIRDVIKVGSTLLTFDGSVTLTLPCVSVSTNNGNSWSATRPAGFDSTDTPFNPISFNNKAFVYIPRSGATFVAHASSPFSSWTVEAVQGLPQGSLLGFVRAGASRIYGVTDDGVLIHSADGISFSSSVISVPPPQTVVVPNFSNVLLLLHLDGTNGSQTFTDSSNSALTVNYGGGSAALTTTGAKFGSACLSLNGTNGYLELVQTITIPANTDATFEWWQNGSFAGATVLSEVFLRVNVNNNGVAIAGVTLSATGLMDIDIGSWRHIAIVRHGTGSGNIKLDINGVSVGTPATSNTQIDFASGTIGRNASSGSAYFNGRIDDFRICNIACYTGNFTPPTAPHPNS